MASQSAAPTTKANNAPGTNTETEAPLVPENESRSQSILRPLNQNRSNLAALGGFTGPKSIFTIIQTSTIHQAFGHPFAYVRALMQMGYEPIAPVRGKTLFGKDALYHANIIQYSKYIYEVDGVVGFYRGFGCSVLSKVVCYYTANAISQLVDPVDETTSNESAKDLWNIRIAKILREVHSQSWGILISHPFEVMALRAMGQFVGREKIYSSINIFQNFNEIYERQGIGGFFVGLIPRWLLETSVIVLTNLIIHLLRTQISSKDEAISAFEFFAKFAAQTVTYPLSVVTTVTAVNRSGLRIGSAPMTPIFANWQDACNYLRSLDQSKRGSSFFNRVATGMRPLS